MPLGDVRHNGLTGPEPAHAAGPGSGESFSPGSRRHPQDRTRDTRVRTPAPWPPLSLILAAPSGSFEAVQDAITSRVAVGVDLLRAGDNGDKVCGGDGNDFIYGGEGPDSQVCMVSGTLLSTEPDSDRFIGGPGNDEFIATAGDDYLSGGRGSDGLTGRSAKIFGGRGRLPFGWCQSQLGWWPGLRPL